LIVPENELAPDLEWMLSSVQAGPALIIETAACEYGAQIYYLALAAQGDEELARRTLQEVLLFLVKRRRAYQSSMDLRKWILLQTLEVCQARQAGRAGSQPVSARQAPGSEPGLWQAFYRLPLEARLLLALHVLLEIELNQAAALLGTNPGLARRDVQAAAEQLHEQVTPTAEPFPPELAQRMRASLPPLTAAQIDEAIAGALQRLEQSARRRRWLALLQPAALIALIAAFVLLESWWSRWSSLPAPTLPAATPTSLPSFFFRPPNSFTAWGALPAHLAGRRPWRTLWLEALTYHYGPPGYIGPPHAWRNQLWLQSGSSDPANSRLQGLVVSGPPAQPAYIVSVQERGLTLLDLASQTIQQLPGVNPGLTYPGWTVGWEGNPGNPQALANLLGDPLLQTLTGLSLLVPEGQLRLVGGEQRLGRSLQVIEHTPQLVGTGGRQVFQRAWIDQESGLVLRWQLYSLGEPPLLLQEVLVQALLLDIEAGLPDPQAILQARDDPTWETLLPPGAESPPGDAFTPAPPRARLVSRTPPPQGADLTRLALTAQWPEEGKPGGVEIYAGGYYLGTVTSQDGPLPAFYQLTCRRSPDGSQVAFSRLASGENELYFASQGLSWIDLAEAAASGSLEVIPVAPQLTRLGRDFAWSPDSSRLAYWACRAQAQPCGVLLFDPETRRNTLLASASYGAVNFTWHPSGDRLAFVRMEADLSTTPRLWVMDTLRNQMVQEGTYSWQFPVGLDSPNGTWWLRPYQPVGLEGCLE
jgi:hypothetical protein